MSTRWSHFRRGKHARKTPPNDPTPEPFGLAKPDSPEYQAKQLRIALEGLGPPYACLALYLSSRVDLLPAEYCRELALAVDAAPPLPPSEVLKLFLNEFGDNAFGRTFDSFEFRAQSSTLTRQSHTAKLTSGDLVTVTFLRPEYYPLQNDQKSRELLDREIVRELCGESVTENAFDDFLHALRRKVNLSLEKEGIESSIHDDKEIASGHLPGRKIYHELSNARVLTLEQQEPGNLNRILEQRHCNLSALAQRICKTWLKQAMSGNLFPVDPQVHHVVVRGDNQLYFEGCELTRLPKAAIDNLWNYLLAALVDDPDRSATHLLQEMKAARYKEIDVQSFRTNFRQAAYFAALEPILGTDSNALAQLIFQHWKTALEHGYSPKPLLLCFYRGLFSVARMARKVSPADDAMREGLEDLQSEKIFDQVRELVGLQHWVQNADKFAGVVVNLPRTFDQALTRTSRPPQDIVIQDRSDSRSQKMAAVAPVFFLIVAVLVAQSTHLTGLSEKAVIGVLMLAGLLALRALSD